MGGLVLRGINPLNWQSNEWLLKVKDDQLKHIGQLKIVGHRSYYIRTRYARGSMSHQVAVIVRLGRKHIMTVWECNGQTKQFVDEERLAVMPPESRAMMDTTLLGGSEQAQVGSLTKDWVLRVALAVSEALLYAPKEFRSDN